MHKNRRRGASLTGYGLIVGLISIVALGAVTTSGKNVSTLFETVGNELGGVTGDNDGQEAAASPSPTPLTIGLSRDYSYDPEVNATTLLVQVSESHVLSNTAQFHAACQSYGYAIPATASNSIACDDMSALPGALKVTPGCNIVGPFFELATLDADFPGGRIVGAAVDETFVSNWIDDISFPAYTAGQVLLPGSLYCSNPGVTCSSYFHRTTPAGPSSLTLQSGDFMLCATPI